MSEIESPASPPQCDSPPRQFLGMPGKNALREDDYVDALTKYQKEIKDLERSRLDHHAKLVQLSDANEIRNTRRRAVKRSREENCDGNCNDTKLACISCQQAATYKKLCLVEEDLHHAKIALASFKNYYVIYDVPMELTPIFPTVNEDLTEETSSSDEEDGDAEGGLYASPQPPLYPNGAADLQAQPIGEPETEDDVKTEPAAGTIGLVNVIGDNSIKAEPNDESRSSISSFSSSDEDMDDTPYPMASEEEMIQFEEAMNEEEINDADETTDDSNSEEDTSDEDSDGSSDEDTSEDSDLAMMPEEDDADDAAEQNICFTYL